MLAFESYQASPYLFWFVCILAAIAFSVSKSGFGGALASLSTPILLFVLPPKLVLGVLLPLFLLTDIWVVVLWRKWLNWRFLLIMCGFGVFGQLLGWLLFGYLSDRVLIGVIGFVGLITALKYARRLVFPSGETSEEVAVRVMRRLWVRAFGWCGLSGMASFLSLAGGIPAQIFLLPHGLPRQAFVGTMGVYFFVINSAKLPFYSDLGLFTPDTLTLSLWLVPVIPVGVFIGKWLNQKMSDRIFYHFSHAVLFLMSIKLLYDVTWGGIGTS
ncbi:MAG: TSUP family transporter [Bacteroidetes bacterium]|nr:TSUP family transporter [Bacteroidota bacterium]